MAIVFSENVNRTASTEVQAGQEITREFEAISDSVVSSAAVIAALASSSSVFKGAPHPDYSFATCTRVDCTANPIDPYHFTLHALYKEPPPQPGEDIDPSGGQPEPDARDPFITGGSFRTQDVARFTDVNGDKYENTAGDPLDNPPPHREVVGVINVQKYAETIDYAVLKGYEGKCNSDAWQGFPVESIRCVGVTWEPVTIRTWVGFRIRATMEHKEVTPEQDLITGYGGSITGGHIPTPILMIGWYYLDGADSFKKKPVVDEYGDKATVPQLLDANGDLLDPADDPVYLGRVEYETTSFAFWA